MSSLSRAGATIGRKLAATFVGIAVVFGAVCAVGFLLAWSLPERPLRETIAAGAGDPGTDSGGAFGRPLDEGVAEAQLVDAFSSLADRQVQRGHIQGIVAQAGETLSPLAAWLLVRVERDPKVDPTALASTHRIPVERMDAAMAELRTRDLIAEPGVEGKGIGELTDAGCAVLTRLVSARREYLAKLVAEWNPGSETAADYLRNSVRDMIADVRRPA